MPWYKFKWKLLRNNILNFSSKVNENKSNVAERYYLKLIVDCEWNDWEIGDCSVECGGGSRVDTRKVAVLATLGGAECSGLSNITENCNLQPCPGRLIHW